MDDTHFKALLASVREGVEILQGRLAPSRSCVVVEPDVKVLRYQHQLTQKQLAILLGISIATLRNWERGVCAPRGSARILLQLLDKHPDAFFDRLTEISTKEGSSQ